MKHLASLTKRKRQRDEEKMADVSWCSEVLFHCTIETPSLDLPGEMLGKVEELKISS